MRRAEGPPATGGESPHAASGGMEKLRAEQSRAGAGWVRGMATVLVALLTAAVVMLGLDLIFLGVVAKPFYDQALGALRAPEVNWTAAGIFYAFYVVAIVWVAVLPAGSVGHAARRGAGMGSFAYGVYELTNWAVLAGWPAALVPIDIAWGVILTGTVAASSHAAMSRLRPADPDWMKPFAVNFMPGEGLPSLWTRRILSVPFVTLLTLITWLGAPVWLLLSAVIDTVRGPRWKWSLTRALAFFSIYLGCQLGGLVLATTLWLATAGGRIVSERAYLAYNTAVQRWWSETIFRSAFWAFSMDLQVEGQEVAAKGPFVLWVRHVSTADTLLAASVVANHHRLLLKYVMKRELLWQPCLDVVGRRLPNAFVDRTGADRTSAVDAVARLGQQVDGQSGVLIYPEGTRFSSEKRERSILRLREKGREDLASLAEKMKHVIPPRLGGVLALLDAARDVDIVVVAHTGFEGAANFAKFFGGGLIGATVRVKLWRIAACDIPAETRERWIFERWAEVDAWIATASS